MATQKKCKGTGRVKHILGCGQLAYEREFGLCMPCRNKWLASNDPEAQEYLLKRIIPRAKKFIQQKEKEIQKEKKVAQWKLNKKTFYSSTAWKYFRMYVILSHSDENLVVRSVTDGKLYRLNIPSERRNVVAGHYLRVFDSNGKTNYSTAFNLKNVYPQSYQENVFNGGNQSEMAKHIEKVHGKQALEELNILSKKPYSLDKFTMEDLGLYWKEKFNNLVQERGVNPFKI